MTEETDQAPGADVAVREPDAVLVRGQLPEAVATDVARFVSGEFMESADDPELIGLQLTAQVLSASTPEEVLASTEAIGVRQYLEQPIELHAVDYQRSEYEEGQPFYVLLRGVDLSTGEQVVLTTGSRRITAQAFQLDRRGWLPQKVTFKQATKPTKAGYYPLKMVQAE